MIKYKKFNDIPKKCIFFNKTFSQSLQKINKILSTKIRPLEIQIKLLKVKK